MSRSEPNTSVHSSKGRLEVIRVARCCATVVRLNAQASPRGEVAHHTIRFAVSIADRPGDSCLATMTQTARSTSTAASKPRIEARRQGTMPACLRRRIP